MYDFLKKFNQLPKKIREEECLYCNEFLADYFEKIIHRLIQKSPELQKMYEENPLPWAVSETPGINAAFCGSYFYVTRGTINAVENEDQLAFVIGHELKHAYEEALAKKKAQKNADNEEKKIYHNNSHAEEAMADINSISLLAKGMYNINEAYAFVKKLPSHSDFFQELRRAMSDVHATKNNRLTMNEAATMVERKKLAAGVYGKEIDANKVPTTPLDEKIHETNYLSYVDQCFQKAHFDSLSVPGKSQFLVDMFFKVVNGSDVRKEDFTARVMNYLETLKEEQDAKADSLADYNNGTSPAMCLIEKFTEAFMQRVRTGKYTLEIDEDPKKFHNTNDTLRFYWDTLGLALILWPTDQVRLETSGDFWRKLKEELADHLDKAKKRVKMKEIDEKEKQQDKEDRNFVVLLSSLFRARTDGDSSFLKADYFSYREEERSISSVWKDLPLWENLELGDRYPVTWEKLMENQLYLDTPVRFIRPFGKGVHKDMYKEYAAFYQNGDWSVMGLKKTAVYDDYSYVVAKIWPSEKEFQNWQEAILKQGLYESILKDLRWRKEQTDQYIAGTDETKNGRKMNLRIIQKLLPTAFSDEYYNNLKKESKLSDTALYKGALDHPEFWKLQDISQTFPEWKYVPRIWLDEDSFKDQLKKPFKFEREYLISLMTEEEKAFFVNPKYDVMKDYSDKIVEAIIAHMQKDHWKLPETTYDSVDVYDAKVEKAWEGISYVFWPDQLQKIIDAFTHNAPATKGHLKQNEEALVRAYKNLLRFYCWDYEKRQEAQASKTMDASWEPKIDCSGFKTSVPEYVLKCYNLPEFSYENMDRWKEFADAYHKSNSHIPVAMQEAVFDSLIHNNFEKIPLSLLDDLDMLEREVSHYYDHYSHLEKILLLRKLKMLGKHEENWPSDLKEFAELVSFLYNKSYIGSRDSVVTKEDSKDEEQVYQVIKNKFLTSLKTNAVSPQKMTDAWVSLGWYLTGWISNPEEYDEIVDEICASPMLKQKVPTRVDLFTQVPDLLWGSNTSKRDKVVTDILNDIEKLPDPHVREELLFKLIKRQNRIANADLLDQAQQMWAKSVFDIMGKEDDESPEYFEKIKPYIDKIKLKPTHDGTVKAEETVGDADRVHILKYLADAVVSQKQLSMAIKPEAFSLKTESDTDIANAGIWVGGISETCMKEFPEKGRDIIAFLRSKGTLEDCRKIRSILYPSFDGGEKEATVSAQEKIRFSLPRIQQAYRNFWSAEPEYQTLIIDHLLKNSAPDCNKKGESYEANTDAWVRNFDYVADEMFPEDTPQSRLLKKGLYAYLSSRPNSDQNLMLAKFFVSAGIKTEKTGEEEANQKIGRGIRMFLEGIGPAGIKLGQALSAVPSIPAYIRDNLKDFTSNVARPARWEIYDWVDNYKTLNPEEKELLDKMKFGKILGSASFFVTLDTDEGKVVKLLRSAANVEAEQEMEYIYNTLKSLSETDESVLGNLGQTLMRIVQQAKESIHIETDLDEGKKQFEIAKNMYPETVTAEDIVFHVKEAEWEEPHGQKWAKMEKMEGVEIDKIQDPKYRHAASMAYFSTEMLNIFSGGRFDFDRHIGQMKIDTEKNTLGLFDTGSMLLDEPSAGDQRALGKILYRTLENALGTEKSFASALTEEIDRFYEKSNQPATYITQVQRGLLALSGFYKDFSVADFARCIDIAFNNPQVKVSEHIMSSFVSEMLERTALFTASTNKNISSEEVADRKEKMGRLLFNLFAAARVSDSDTPIGEILQQEEQSFQEAKLPVIGRLLFSKKMRSQKDHALSNIKIPGCFATHIVDAMKGQKMDPIVVKGMMKEAWDTICLKDKRDSSMVKKEFGRQLYDVFVLFSKKGASQEEIIQQLKQSLQGMSKKSILARNLLAVLTLSEQTVPEDKINLKDVIAMVIGQKDLDRDIWAGIQSSMKKNGQTLHLLMSHFRRPLSAIGNVRHVFSLFKDHYEPGLKMLLQKASKKLEDMPQQVTLKQTEKGEVLSLPHAGNLPVAGKNPSIAFRKKNTDTVKQ